MTQDGIIRMALEADIDANAEGLTQALERFAAIVAANEREACAKVCDEIARSYQRVGTMVADVCAAAIRARGEK